MMLRCRDPGEQVLGAARKSGHFVREHRAADEDMVVLGDEPIQRDGHILRQLSVGDRGDVGGRDRAKRRKAEGSSQR